MPFNYAKYRLFFHIGFWLFYVGFFTVTWVDEDGLLHSFYYELFHLPLRMAQVYFGLYFLLPRFLLKRKYILFGALLFLTFSIAGLLQNYIEKHIYYGYLLGQDIEKTVWHAGDILRASVRSNSVFVVAAALKILKYWFEKEKEAISLQQEKTTAELKFLKSQIQPHFFFNTLNTLYGLTLAKSPKSPEVVLKLSDLMRYMLYETKEERVYLEKEINYLENYIELEKLRFGDRFEVHFSQKGRLDRQLIPPMVLLPFVENAFKHSLEEKNSAFISIELEVLSNMLYFKVENTIAQSKPGVKEEGGIGLENVKKRLQLLFPDNHQLKTFKENGLFLASLKIPLKQ